MKTDVFPVRLGHISTKLLLSSLTDTNSEITGIEDEIRSAFPGDLTVTAEFEKKSPDPKSQEDQEAIATNPGEVVRRKFVRLILEPKEERARSEGRRG